MNFLVYFLTLLFLKHANSQNTRRITEQPFFNYNDMLLGPIGLGNPTQLTFMALDPMSTEFFIVDSQCKTSGCRSNRKGFNTGKSPTFKQTGMPFQAYYQGSYQNGRIATEEFTALGLGNAPRLPIPLVDKVNGPFIGSKADGVMGWGLRNGKPSMLRQLLSKVDEPVITVFMSSYKYVPSKGGITDSGLATYGGSDIKHCQMNYQKVPLSASDKWQINAQSVTFGNLQFRGGRVLIQPGIRRLYGTASALMPLLRRVNAIYDYNLHEYVVNCASVNQLPGLTFHYHGVSLLLLPRDYTVKAGNQKCILPLGILDPQIQQTDWLVGDVLLRSHCIQLDFGNRAIGFSKSLHFAS